MSTQKGYTTRQNIENYLLITIDPTFYAQIDNWIAEVEAYIDGVTERNFVALAEDKEEVRNYDGDLTGKLLIDDCVEVVEVKLSPDSDPLEENVEYNLYPLNARARGLPITQIRLPVGVFPNWPPQVILVKARWGYSEEVPGDIATAATVFVAGIINKEWKGEDDVQSETIGRYSVQYKDKKQIADFDRATETLQSYRKYAF